MTFSVVPKMTFLWALLMQKAITAESTRILIGDCSGGAIFSGHWPGVQAFPLLNWEHGVKLDYFLNRVCAAQYAIISDDDVFWLNEKPLNWALAQFAEDSKLAAVSFMPRQVVSSVMKDKVPQPMGSYCLVIRRQIWMKERLSFRIVHPSPSEGYDWFYDTADFANVELLRRGYRVGIAPAEIREHLCCLEAISTWTLKIQQRKGNLERSIADIALRRVKAYRAILALRGISGLLERHFSGQVAPEVVRGDYLD